VLDWVSVPMGRGNYKGDKGAASCKVGYSDSLT